MSKSPLNEEALLRLPNILGDPDADPPIPAIIHIKRSAWWAGVKSGRFPKPVRLGGTGTYWRASDIRRLIDESA